MATSGRARRADARRNMDTIVEAAILTLGVTPDATMADIASAAGVGRVTVYAHFASRADLIRAVMERVLADGDAALSDIDLSGDAREALIRLIEASWQQIARIGSVTTAAMGVLEADELLRLHQVPAGRVRALVHRGRSEGVFRTDLSESWLVGVLHALMQAAAVEVGADRLDPAEGATAITATALAAYAIPTGQ